MTKKITNFVEALAKMQDAEFWTQYARQIGTNKGTPVSEVEAQLLAVTLSLGYAVALEDLAGQCKDGFFATTGAFDANQS